MTSSTPCGGSPPRSRSEPRVSAVVPVFDEEENLEEFHGRLMRALETLGPDWEIVYVDDGSTDGSLERMAGWAGRDPRVRVVELTRNWGQHAAVFAGFEVARGAVVVTLDADLQNPPEEIPRLVAKAEEGFDVVGTRRRVRRDPWWRRAASRLVNRLAGGTMTDYGCMLRAYRRELVEQLLRCGEISSFLPLLANQYARRTVEIEVDHRPRERGRTKYGLLRLINLQFDLMTGFSLLPLRAMTFFGAAVAAASAGLGVLLLVLRWVHGREWAQFGVFTLFAILFLMVGMLFVALGVLGEYVGRIYAEVRRRPRYVVRRIHGGDGP
ncbi:MAG: glycosyltransferase [Planctomycetota bacterium]